MITTVTANPAVDYTVQVENLQLDEVNSAYFGGITAAGKGINVAKAVTKLKETAQILGCIGGRTGEFIVDKLQQKGIPIDFNWVTASTRINVKVIDKNNQETKINLAGSSSLEGEKQLKQKVIAAAGNSDIIVLTGSLPQEFSSNFYCNLIEQLQGSAKVFLDTSGKALELAVPTAPTLIKPNQRELEELCGRELSLQGIVNVSQELVNKGIEIVLVSRGERGAVLTTEAGSLQALVPAVEPESTVGAGDSLVGSTAVGYLQQKSPAEMLRFAVGESIATILRPGAEMGTYQEAEKWKQEVKIKKLN